MITGTSPENPIDVAEPSAAEEPAKADLKENIGKMFRKLGIGKSADDTLRAHTARGSIIAVMDFGTRQVLSLGSNLVLAWLLFPKAFGLMALVAVVLRGLKMFSDVGIGPSIVRHPRGSDPEFLNTAWTMQVMRGLGLWIGCCVLAWPASIAFEAPELAVVLPIATFTSVIAGLNSTSCFTLPRAMSWGPTVVLGLISQFVSVAVMVGLAWWWRSVWALVAGAYAQSIVMAVGTHFIGTPHRHRLRWEREAVHELFKFGRWIFVSSVLTFLAGQLDRLILGRLLTLDEFGVYMLALTVSMMPGAICGQLAATVLFPALASSARDKPQEMMAKIRAARNVILPGSLVATLGVAFGAPILFEYLYDERYAGAAGMTQWLSIAAWFSLLQISTDRGVLALGYSKSLAVCSAVKLVVTVGASLVGYREFGLEGFMAGLAVGTLASHIVVQAVLWKLKVRLIDQDILYTALAAVVGTTGVAIPMLVPYPPGSTGHLVTLIVTAVACLGPLTLWAGKRIVREVLKR